MLVAKASHCSPVGAAELLTLLQAMIFADDEKSAMIESHSDLVNKVITIDHLHCAEAPL